MSQEVKMISVDEALKYVLKHFEPLEPEQVLAIRPSPELQACVSELLGRNKERELSRQEETELERYLTLEHLVRLAKAHAQEQAGRNC